MTPLDERRAYMLAGLQAEIHATALVRKLYEGKTIAEHFLHLLREMSEVCEAYDQRRFEEWYGPDGKPEGVTAELADVIILVLSISAHYELPIARAVIEKIAYNVQRKD